VAWICYRLGSLVVLGLYTLAIQIMWGAQKQSSLVDREECTSKDSSEPSKHPFGKNSLTGIPPAYGSKRDKSRLSEVILTGIPPAYRYGGLCYKRDVWLGFFPSRLTGFDCISVFSIARHRRSGEVGEAIEHICMLFEHKLGLHCCRLLTTWKWLPCWSTALRSLLSWSNVRLQRRP